MKYETIKIDIAFPDFRATQLKQFLSEGWRIVDKTVMSERYIYYVIGKDLDNDVGKCSDQSSENV